MTKYRVTAPLDVSSKNERGQTIVTTQRPGDIVELEDSVAEVLLDRECIELVSGRRERRAPRAEPAPEVEPAPAVDEAPEDGAPGASSEEGE